MRAHLAIVVGISLLNIGLLVPVAPVMAQRAAEASIVSAKPATLLAQESLQLLKRGEDSTDPAAKEQYYKQGLDLARQAVAADDTNADAHFALFANLGRTMQTAGAVANPLNLYRVNRELDRTLQLDPHHSDALAAKGGMYRQLPTLLGGSLAKAADYLERAVAADPEAVGARIELARTYRDMGQTTKAVPVLETATTLAERMGKTRQLSEARQLLAAIRRAH